MVHGNSEKITTFMGQAPGFASSIRVECRWVGTLAHGQGPRTRAPVVPKWGTTHASGVPDINYDPALRSRSRSDAAVVGRRAGKAGSQCRSSRERCAFRAIDVVAARCTTMRAFLAEGSASRARCGQSRSPRRWVA